MTSQFCGSSLRTTATNVFQEALLLSGSSFDIVFIEGLGVVLRKVLEYYANCMENALVVLPLGVSYLGDILATQPYWEPVDGCLVCLGFSLSLYHVGRKRRSTSKSFMLC